MKKTDKQVADLDKQIEELYAQLKKEFCEQTIRKINNLQFKKYSLTRKKKPKGNYGLIEKHININTI